MEILRKEIKGNATVIYINGRMDVHFVGKIEEEFYQMIQNIESPVLIINLFDVEYISSSALRIFVRALKTCNEKDIQMRLACLRPPVKKVFYIVEMDTMFSIFETEEEALK